MIRRLAALGVSLTIRACDMSRDLMLRCLGRPLSPRGVVLYYHAVTSRQRSKFARQMDALLRRTRPFSADRPETIAHRGYHTAVTFDDGFRSVVENAVPELTRRGIPFTMFVPTGCLGERPSWIRDATHPSWQERVLSACELRVLAQEPLVSIGSHSITHPNFLHLDLEGAREEFRRSRADLEALVGRRVDAFSYPHGAHTRALDHEARAAGYRRVFTIEPRTLDDREVGFTIGRVLANPDDWPLEFRLKIVGAYRWRTVFRRRGNSRDELG